MSWTTNVGASSRVDYGLTPAYGANVSDSTLVTSHSLTLTSLTCNTTYHYQITSVSSGGSASTADSTFTTGACPITISGISVSTDGDHRHGELDNQRECEQPRGLRFDQPVWHKR